MSPLLRPNSKWAYRMIKYTTLKTEKPSFELTKDGFFNNLVQLLKLKGLSPLPIADFNRENGMKRGSNLALFKYGTNCSQNSTNQQKAEPRIGCPNNKKLVRQK